MKILISGAGPAGLTLAYWLKRYGFTPTLVERAPNLVKGGYKIDVRGAALQVLHRMAIYDAVLKASTDMQGAILIDKQGKTINQMSGDAFGHRIGDDVEIIRGELCQILMDNVPDVEFIWNDVIQEVNSANNKITVNFKNHPSREFDLVIGADGLHSKVRQIVFGDEAHFSRKFGLYLCVFTLPNYLELDRMEMQYTEMGRVISVWSTRGSENIMRACFVFAAPSNSIDLHNRAEQQEILKTVYQDLAWEVPKFLQLMSEASDFYFDEAAQIDMNPWTLGRVALLGDAAYCPSPMSGQGTSLALIGAYVLAGELAQAKGNYQKAFAAYDAQLRSFVKRNQELGITSANLMKSKEKASVISWLIMKIMQLAPGWFIKFILNLSTRRIHQVANSITLRKY